MKYLADNPRQLWNHIVRGVRFLEPWSALYATLRDEYVGGCWPGVAGRRMVNYVNEMVVAIESYCTVNKVRAAITPKAFKARQFSEIVRLAMNQAYDEMKFSTVIEQAASESLFAPIAVVEIGRHEGPRTMEIDGEEMNMLEPYARVVPLTDLTLDPDARGWDQRRWCGRRVTIEQHKIGQLGVDDPAVAEQLGVDVMTTEEAAAWIAGMNMREYSSDERTGRYARDMRKQGQGSAFHSDEPSGEVNLWRVAIYDGNKVWIVYTPDSENQPKKFLHVERWDETKQRDDGTGQVLELGGGSPAGPFRALTFYPVVNSLIGLPGLAAIYDLHDAAKKISNKLVNQLLSLKNLLLYEKSAADDAIKVTKAKDLDSIAVRDASKFNVAPIGGTRGELAPGLEMLSAMFGNIGGNTRQVSGTEQSADTATAATYMQNGANMRLGRFRSRLWKLASDCSEEIAFLGLFADPWAYKALEMPMAPGISIPVVFNRAEIAADAEHFMFAVEPFPTPIFDPMMKAQRIDAFLAFVTNNMPMIQMGILNPLAVARIGRTEYGIDDVEDLLPGLDQLAPTAGQMLMQRNTMGLMPNGIQQMTRQLGQMQQQGGGQPPPQGGRPGGPRPAPAGGPQTPQTPQNPQTRPRPTQGVPAGAV